MKESINVVIKRPGEEPEVSTLANTLDAMQAVVEGYIEVVNLGDGLFMLCNEEGLIRDLAYNANVCGHNVFGTIAFIGIDGQDFDDCPVSATFIAGMIYGSNDCEPTLGSRIKRMKWWEVN